MDSKKIVIEQLTDSAGLKGQLKSSAEAIVAIAECIIQALKRGNKVLLFGNGGSAADAQHIAAELSGKYMRDRSPLPAIALTTNTSALTAIANDYGYDSVFARQLRALVIKGDVVIGISTSGDSSNVIKALQEAKRCGAITVTLCGHGGKLNKLADHVLAVPSTDTPRIQEAHITIGHIICYLIEEELFGQEGE